MADRVRYFKLGIETGEDYDDEIPRVEPERDIVEFTDSGLKLVAAVVTAKGTRAPPHRLFVVGSDPLLLRDEAYAAVATLRLCKSIEWHPVTVKWKRTRYNYRVGDTTTKHDIWDYRESEYSSLNEQQPRGKENVGLWNRGVADQSLLPQLDLFRSCYWSWIGSETFKVAWETGGFTGIEFIELPVASRHTG